MPKRVSFLKDEKTHAWLSMLLDAYHIVDLGVDLAVKKEQKGDRRAACGKGCSNCCSTHKTIPVYPLELVGISWYVIEKIKGRAREILRKQLVMHREDGPCPFLADKVCLVHNMRPISCRQFIVFGKSCAEGEDPYYTRREDVLTPIKEYTDKAVFTMLPFYGVSEETERRKAIEQGSMNKLVSTLHGCNWK
ncbi:MAG: YkgJ family cysteine cluster protein, partial [Nitrospirae bacterium]|nr:YkgJ family cysteine cluster protein [Nitrospirota bacterium]